MKLKLGSRVIATGTQQMRRRQIERQIETNRKHSTYRNGEFWIGRRKVEKWNPRKVDCPGDGMFFNSVTARFEVWKDARMLSDIPWKLPWQTLVNWADRFGFNCSERP